MSRLTPSMIPRSPNFDVIDSSFFHKFGQLPSPKDVQEQAKTQHLAGVNPDRRRVYSTAAPYVRPPPVVFESMGLFVKWGSTVNISEGLTLYAIYQLLKGQVPVPEIYGWRTDGDEKYIYMQYIKGQNIEQAWDEMEHDDRAMISSELQIIYKHLRQLNQDPVDPFVGNIVRDPLYDRAFNIKYMEEAGPFATVRDFHNWFTFLHRRPMADPYSVPEEPFRHDLPDNCAITFTHGDLHPSNIIISANRPYRILAIVDWEQSGWLPAYWEARKAQYTADRDGEWSTKYLPIILDQHDATWDPWDYYTTAMGC